MSTLRTNINSSPTDCFATFPFPPAEDQTPDLPRWLALPAFAHAARIGAASHKRRREIMQARRIGLTKTSNLVHDLACRDADSADLRRLHAALDAAILACSGWDDRDPGRDVHATARGQTRFGMAPDGRRTMVQRLLDLTLAVAQQRG